MKDKEIKTKRKNRINIGGQNIIYALQSKIIQKAARYRCDQHKNRKYFQIKIGGWLEIDGATGDQSNHHDGKTKI